jgi:hypothetical protein
MTSILIGLIFCSGFFVESIIGFGGTLVAFAILGFFVDIKQLILMAIFVATTASIFVIASDYKQFSKEIFFKSFPFCLIGTFIGSVFFTHSNSKIILLSFALLLLLLSAKIIFSLYPFGIRKRGTNPAPLCVDIQPVCLGDKRVIFFDNLKLSKHFSNLVLTIGGISQGIFGIGGPFFAIALKDKFHHKSQMRATLAMFFISFNLIRVCQFTFNQTLSLEVFLTFWWVPAPLAIAIHLGHLVHKKLSESKFKKAFVTLTTFSGIVFLFKK